VKRYFAGVHAQRRAIAVGFAVVVGLGVVAALGLPTSILPEVTFPRITILAESGEQPSETMLRTVTRPIEESLHRVPGVGEIRSNTSRCSAEITVDGAWRSDMNLMLQRVQAQIATVRSALPSEAVIDARVMNPTLFPVLGFSLTSDRVSLARLRDVAVTMLKPELSRLPGVAEVIVQGGRRLEARVELNPAALQARGLDAASVAEAIRTSSTLASVGLMETNSQLYLGSRTAVRRISRRSRRCRFRRRRRARSARPARPRGARGGAGVRALPRARPRGRAREPAAPAVGERGRAVGRGAPMVRREPAPAAERRHGRDVLRSGRSRARVGGQRARQSHRRRLARDPGGDRGTRQPASRPGRRDRAAGSIASRSSRWPRRTSL
jgi:hypothetical protein